MSILFESLSQKESGEVSSVPDVHASHFDDAMLGDEWLLRRLSWWRLGCIILLTLLLASWFYFFVKLYQVDSSAENNHIIAHSTSQVEADKRIPVKPPQSSAAINQPMQVVQFELPIETNEIKKRVYKPQKDSGQTAPEVVLKKSLSQNKTTSKQASSVNAPAVFFEQLSPQQQSQFPNIEISSYVVADSVKDSFIILDGKFYKVDQVISADLILRKIGNENIEVEFQSQMVKIPLK